MASITINRKRKRNIVYGRRKRVRRNQMGLTFARVTTNRPRAPPATRGFYFPNRGELKFLDGATTLVDVTTAGSFTLMNGMIQGTDAITRIGRKIVVRSFYIRGFLQLENALNLTTTGTQGQCARMIILCDMQPNGGAPTVPQLLVEALPTSQLNLDNRDRFKIYVDKMFYFDPMVISTTATQSFGIMNHTGQHFKKWKKINLETIYNIGNSGLIGDISSGSLYIFFIGQFPNIVNGNVSANFSRRIRFFDP